MFSFRDGASSLCARDLAVPGPMPFRPLVSGASAGRRLGCRRSRIRNFQIFGLTEVAGRSIDAAILAHQQGRIAIVTRRGPGCGGRDGVGAGRVAGRECFRERQWRAQRHGAESVFTWSLRCAHASRGESSGDVRGRRSRVVLAPEVWRQAWRMRFASTGASARYLPGDGGNRARLPGESAKETVKTIRAGKAECRLHL